MKTAEFVTPKHPDKVCDHIADAILDAYVALDPESRVAVEIMGGHKQVAINGEVTSAAVVDVVSLVKEIVGEDYNVTSNIAKQSSEIARGVDLGGAGDQGIMKGYATSETENFMPMEYELARNLCMKVFEAYPYDGKTQVTIDDVGRVTTVVVSFQNSKNEVLEKIVKEYIQADEYLFNPAGEWTQGGFDGDTGLSGRKLIVDNYGPEIPIGGGSYSGKDYTKVDRSGSYMARKIAVDFLKKHGAREVYTRMAYAIGKPEPVMAIAVVDGVEIYIDGYDLTPKAIRKTLDLDTLKYVTTSDWGHFGRGFAWDS